MISIRRSLTLRLLIGIAAAVATGTTLAYLLARHALVAQFDEAMLEKARALALQVDHDEEGVAFDLQEGLLPEYERGDSPEYFTVTVHGLGTLATSPSLADGTLTIEGAAPHDVELPDGRRGRINVWRGTTEYEEDDEPAAESEGMTSGHRAAGVTPPPVHATVIVARSRESLDAALSQLALGLFLTLALSCVTVLAIVSSSVRRGLAPVVRMGEQVARIDADSLSERVPLAEQPEELAPLGHVLNRLLGRLDRAFDRERRMTASMAHELRTPISEILSAAEIARKWPDDPQLQADAIETAENVASEMGCVVAALLRLSRRDAGAEDLTLERCDVTAEITATIAAFSNKATEKSIGVVPPVSDSVDVRADRDLMHVIVRNLVDNAVSHTPTGGLIESDIAIHEDRVTWTIANSPVTLDEKDIAHLDEPFWTRDGSRTSREHSGLGIALAESAARAIGASIEFRLSGANFVAAVSMHRDQPVRNRSTVSA